MENERLVSGFFKSGPTVHVPVCRKKISVVFAKVHMLFLQCTVNVVFISLFVHSFFEVKVMHFVIIFDNLFFLIAHLAPAVINILIT